MLLLIGVGGEGGTYEHSYALHQLQSAVSLALVEFHGLQCAVVVEWYGGVEEQVAVVYGIHAAVAQYGGNVFVEFLAHGKGMV